MVLNELNEVAPGYDQLTDLYLALDDMVTCYQPVIIPASMPKEGLSDAQWHDRLRDFANKKFTFGTGQMPRSASKWSKVSAIASQHGLSDRCLLLLHSASLDKRSARCRSFMPTYFIPYLHVCFCCVLQKVVAIKNCPRFSGMTRDPFLRTLLCSCGFHNVAKPIIPPTVTVSVEGFQLGLPVLEKTCPLFLDRIRFFRVVSSLTTFL